LECCYKRLTVRTGQIKFDRSTSVSFDLSRPTNNRKVINTPCDTYKTNIKKLTALSEILRGIHIHTHTHFYLQPIQHYTKRKKTLSQIILRTRVAHIYIIVRRYKKTICPIILKATAIRNFSVFFGMIKANSVTIVSKLFSMVLNSRIFLSLNSSDSYFNVFSMAPPV